MRHIVVSVLLLLGMISCVKDNTIRTDPQESDGSPTDPTPVPTPIDHKIQIVVQGSVTTATIRYTSEKEGTQNLTAQLPWMVSYHVNKDTTFLSVSATTFEMGTVGVQVWVDNILFRETVVSSAFADPVLGTTATIAGNFDISSTALSILSLKTQQSIK